MGNAVYEDRAARDLGVDRWAGYGVPGVCDQPDCDVEIDRGLGYRCEIVTTYRYFADQREVTEDDDWDEEIEEDGEGCGLHFCEDHLYSHAAHAGITPKPDTVEWERHVLTDESWGQWRSENVERVEQMRQRVEAAS